MVIILKIKLETIIIIIICDVYVSDLEADNNHIYLSLSNRYSIEIFQALISSLLV